MNGPKTFRRMRLGDTRPVALVATLAILATAQTSCQTLREITALGQVDFALDRVTDMTLAGVDLSRVNSYSDLRTSDLGRLTTALMSGRMPLAFNLHVSAENPSENSVQARLIEMDWTLFLQKKETVAGRLEREVVLPPGQPTDIPLGISLDLVDFVEGSVVDLVELALAVAGDERGRPKEVELRARPTVQTAIGPIRYPDEITIVSQTVGGDR